MSEPRPNILIVMVDQMNPAFLPPYGDKVAVAPNITALAEDGVVFDSAYCNSPLCGPSRAAFMTGLLPSHSGVYDNAAEFPADIPTYAHHLRALGYQTILSGKMHFCGPDQLHGFERRLTTDIYPADFGWTPDWEKPSERPDWYHNMSSVTQAGVTVRTNQLDFDDEVTFTSERALYDLARSGDKRPFLLVASFTHPHDPFAIPKRYWDLYRDADIPMPSPEPAEQDPHTLRLRHVCAMDAGPLSHQNIRDARHAYYGAISYVDENLGRLVAALGACGFADDTIVLFTSDHGETLGERGLWYKMNFFEGGARVPLIVSAPKKFPPRRVAANVSLIDILPTLIELAGRDAAAVSRDVDGRSLMPHLETGAGHDDVFAEYCAEGAIAPCVMIRRARFKFIHSPVDPDQLFDLEADPKERRNLAGDGAHAKTLETFRAEVRKRWNLEALDADVRASQARRRLVAAALAKGEVRAWDFQPHQDAAKSYVRNTIPLDDLEAMARFPRV